MVLFSIHCRSLQGQGLHAERSSIQNQNTIVQGALVNLVEHLENNSAFFNDLSTYPLPAYPGREQENMLHVLLRTKLTPREAEFVDEGNRTGKQTIGSDVDGWNELWEWAAIEANGLARGHDWGGTEEENGEEDTITADHMADEKEAQGEPLSLTQWMKFVSKGEMPAR